MVEVALSAAVVLLGVTILELALRRAVRSARRSFQWMVTEGDAIPPLDRAALGRFLASSFSSELGWEPVPGSTGSDVAHGTETRFAIGPDGARSRPVTEPGATVGLFGDSYAFGRQVEDHETWAALLGSEHGVGVLNFGVGNYGVDQALLRYRRRPLPAEVDTVVVAFVPETIGRVQSIWKHWMEFGNTFGFKPRFTLGDDGLTLMPCPVQGAEDFDRLPDIVAMLQDQDPFHRSRFRRYQFRPPYFLSLLRAPIRNLTILPAVLLGRRGGSGSELRTGAFERAFARIMRSNVREAHRLYGDVGSAALLTAVLEQFRDEVESEGRRFVVCVIPQLLDLSVARSSDRSYRVYFQRLGERMEVVDMTDDMRSHPAAELFIHDRYGGHLSRRGNRVVALRMAEVLG